MTLAVGLILVTAVTLLGTRRSKSLSESREPVAAIASSGELSGLLADTPSRRVPEPIESDLTEVPPSVPAAPIPSRIAAFSESESPSDLKPQVASAVSETKQRLSDLESEIELLRGQLSELTRSQLESQLAEIRRAEQLLSQHQTSREIASLEREILDLKSRMTTIGNSEVASPVVNTTTPPAETDSQEVVERNPLRIVASADNPSRVDVDADDVPLPQLLASLGKHLHWNLVIGPGIHDSVNCHWQAVDPEPALRQLLKSHGWQIRLEGELAIVEPLLEAELPPVHSADPPTQTASLPETSHQEPVQDRTAEPTWEKSSPQEVPSSESSADDSTMTPPIESAVIPESQESSGPAEEIPAESPPAEMPADTESTPEAAPSVPEENNDAIQNQQSLMPRVLPALPATMTQVFRPRHISSQKLLPHVRPLLTENSGEATTMCPDSSARDILLVKDQPSVIAQVEELVRELDVPDHQFEVSATILQFRVPAEIAGTVYRRGIPVDSEVHCPQCGIVHSADEQLSMGHVQHGWLKLAAGMSSGICPMSADQITAQLRKQPGITITALAPREVANQGLANIALTQQKGFHRLVQAHTVDQTAAEVIPSDPQLKIRPILQTDGTVELEILTNSENLGHAHVPKLNVAAHQCVVVGGLVFEHRMDITPAGQSDSERELHEIVVLIQVKSLRESNTR